jgi:hypothetical protein
LEVFGHRVAAGAASGVSGMHQLDVTVQQFGEPDIGTGPTAVANLVDQATGRGVGVGKRGRTAGNGVAEVALTAGDRMDAGIDPDPQ